MDAFDPNSDLNNLDRALAQYRQAAHAAEPQGPSVAGITVVTTDGKQLGILPLSANAIRRLTGAVEAATYWATDHPGDFVDDQAHAEHLVMADISDLFADVDLAALTKTVLDDSTPADRLTVTQAIDGMFGHIPRPGVEDGDL